MAELINNAGWIASQSAIKFFIRLHGLPDNSFVKGVKLSDYQAWIAASHGTDPAIMAQWQQSLASMQQDGTLQRLAAKYLITPLTDTVLPPPE